ncbi:MAG: hypothetical protein A3H91_10275 [Gammaproteobacteria bacterium RIFCSPLOWO2_02_FULL_61_13]|nr:MAG: hypothetical protein A3H91_10275 [Gammaproteobacteria bacterium RIFCSPLOWO2_02_FULL_61_13]
MNKTLIFHIGVHKTGTTSIQRFLNRNSQHLRRHGILYPDSGRPATHPDAHHQLAWALLGSHGVRDLACWSDVLAEFRASDCPVALLSSEGFCTLRDQQVEKLAALVGGFDVRVIMYVRDPVSYMISSYKMGINLSNRTESFGEFVRREIHRCDFRRSHGIWCGHFGAARVALLEYAAAVGGAGLIPHFLAQLALDPAAFPAHKDEYANRSSGDQVVQMVRFLNGLQAQPRFAAIRGPAELVKSGLKYRRLFASAAAWIFGRFLSTSLYTPEELAELERQAAEFKIQDQ